MNPVYTDKQEYDDGNIWYRYGDRIFFTGAHPPKGFDIIPMTLQKEYSDYWSFLVAGWNRYELDKEDMDMSDNVNQPKHYTSGKFEVIDILKDKMTKEQYEGFCLGNLLKYSMRFQHKNGLEDLKKAKVYLDWLIESKES